MKVRKVKPQFEKNNGVEHAEHQCVNTRVSHYLEMYAKGMISDLPKTYRQDISVNSDEVNQELLNGRLPLPHMGTDPVEIMDYLHSNIEHFEALANDYNLAVKDKQDYDKCMSVINDENADESAKYEALQKLDAIEKRARARAV